MKQQFLNNSGLTELIGYIKKYVKDEQDVKPYASLSVFPKTGEQNIIYIDTTVNASYYWDDTSNTYKALDVQTWATLNGKPSTFPPEDHNHDDRYFTETEMNSKLAGKANSSHKHKKADITDFPTSMPASDVPAWAKASTKPTYTKAEVGLGNVDNTADKDKSVKYATSAGSAGSVAWGNVSGRPSSMPASDVYSWAKASSKPSYSWSEISGRPSSLPANGGNASTVNGHTVNANVPAGAVFTDTNTWRPCVNNLTSDSTDQSLSAAQGKILKDKLDKLVPIGYIFIWNNRKLTNFNETLSGAPDLTSAQAVHDYFGFGTWQYVGDTFLYGNPNSQGGASTVSLGVGNMPSHTHSIPALSGWAANNGAHAHNVRAKYTNNCATKSSGSARANGGGNNTSDWRFGDTDSQGTHGHNVSTNASTTGSNGSGSAFSIMPPYKGVYIWQRIA